ncbi:hypothetical protein MMC11_002324 [Xylographa trunciseda]|nr:hypothetical protein [Xylographa trunciseda]
MSSTDILDLPESKKRRLLELRLLHHYMTKTSLRISGQDEPTAVEPWTTILPGLAIEHDALLYSMYALAALHLSRLEPDNAEVIDAYRNYLGLALQKHRADVSELSKTNSDAACLTSSLIRLYAFAVLQERPLSPYTPPTQFLYMTSGALMVFHEAWDSIADDESSIAVQIVKNTTIWSEGEASFEDSWRAPLHARNGLGLSHLMRRDVTEDPPEPWDLEIQEAYQSTVNYIGSIQIAITAGEAAEHVLRRLLLFPVLIPKRFIDLVAEQHPRALVVLAHYFALIARFQHIWWIGDGGRREVRGIQTALPAEWSGMMSWPLSATEDESME